MASEFRRRYHLYLSGNDQMTDVFTPLFAETDEAALERLSGDLLPLIDAFPIGQLCTDDGVLIWRKGSMDA